MLVIISDLHLGDGTTAASIPASAFKLFAKRLRETATFASVSEDGTFHPIKSLEVVLLTNGASLECELGDAHPERIRIRMKLVE